MAKGAYIYQQIELSTAEWAVNEVVYPASVWLFERLESGKFNMKLSDAVHKFSELPAVLQDVVVEIHSNTDAEYILKFTTANGVLYTPNLRMRIRVVENTADSYKMEIQNGNDVIETPNLRSSIKVIENTSESYKMQIRSGDDVIETPNLKGSAHPQTPTLPVKPDENTLTYTVEGLETAFIIGQMVRVPSKSQLSGYTFYQLAALSDDGASWQEAGSGGGGSGADSVPFTELDDLEIQSGEFFSGDAGWNSFTFPTKFTGIPTVTCAVKSTDYSYLDWFVNIQYVTETGFLYHITHVNTEAYGTSSTEYMEIMYQAIYKK